MQHLTQLRLAAYQAASKAYAPYSQVGLGCAVLAGSEIFAGSNVENASYGATICAERAAIWQAVNHGHRNLQHLYLYSPGGWPPCGMCRQVMAEFAGPELKITLAHPANVKSLNPNLTTASSPAEIIIDGQKIALLEQHLTFGQLFPWSFNPTHLAK
ncbi:MAG: cytidine deaminase [Bacteriovoracaceae bacterium]|nr:cytidine deaminase [Bacteriovoracaceae bacterium]